MLLLHTHIVYILKNRLFWSSISFTDGTDFLLVFCPNTCSLPRYQHSPTRVVHLLGSITLLKTCVCLYTLLYLKWIISKDLLYSPGNSAQCYMAVWMGGEFGGDGCTYIYTYMAESLCCSPETITTLLTGYTPTQNKKFFKKNNPMLTHHYHQKSTVEL